MVGTNYSRLKALIVDDERACAVSVLRILRRKGCREYIIALNGEKGLDVYLSQRPDLVITDVDMPVMNGIEMIRKIRGDYAGDKTRIVCMSGLCHEREALEAGANAFLAKPFEPRDLIEVVNSTILRS